MIFNLKDGLGKLIENIVDNDIFDIVPKKWNKVLSIVDSNVYSTQDPIHAFENCILMRKSDQKLFDPVIISKNKFMLCDDAPDKCLVDLDFVNDEIMFLYCIPTRCGFGFEIEIDGKCKFINDEKNIELNVETKEIKLI